MASCATSYCLRAANLLVCPCKLLMGARMHEQTCFSRAARGSMLLVGLVPPLTLARCVCTFADGCDFIWVKACHWGFQIAVSIKCCVLTAIFRKWHCYCTKFGVLELFVIISSHQVNHIKSITLCTILGLVFSPTKSPYI